jgi:hypothetical protein
MQEVLKATNSPTFVTVFNSTVLFSLFKYGKIRPLVSMVVLITMFFFRKTVGPTVGPIVAQVWVQLSRENGVVIMVSIRDPSWSHVDWCNFASTSEV